MVTDWTRLLAAHRVARAGAAPGAAAAERVPPRRARPASQRDLSQRRADLQRPRPHPRRWPDRHDAAAHGVGSRPTRAPRPGDRCDRRAAAARRRSRRPSSSAASSASGACAAWCSCGRWRRLVDPRAGVAGRVRAAVAVARHDEPAATDASGVDPSWRRRGLPARPGGPRAAVRLRVRRRGVPHSTGRDEARREDLRVRFGWHVDGVRKENVFGPTSRRRGDPAARHLRGAADHWATAVRRVSQNHAPRQVPESEPRASARPGRNSRASAPSGESERAPRGQRGPERERR